MNTFSILLSLLVTLEMFSTINAIAHTKRKVVRSTQALKHPTILYASADFGFPRPASQQNSRFTVHQTQNVGAIPPSFVTGAYLYPSYTDKFLVKPKRWAISTLYDSPAYYGQKDSHTDAEFDMKEQPPQTMNENFELLNEAYDGEDDYENLPQGEPFVREYPLPYPYQEPKENEHLNQESNFVDQERNVEDVPSFEILNQPYMYEDIYSNQYQPYNAEKNTEPERQVYRSENPWPVAQGHPAYGECHQERSLGVGPDEVSSWYFDLEKNRCWWFGYRGKGGNANRFSSRSACENYCIHGISDLCQTVTCKWSRTRCELVADEECEQMARQEGRAGNCPPRQPVCMSRHHTRIAPELNTTSVPGECHQLKDEGSCHKRSPDIRFYYNPSENNCNYFYFHGCGGNDNRFEAKHDCMAHCAP